jgi:hypothetical protein
LNFNRKGRARKQLRSAHGFSVRDREVPVQFGSSSSRHFGEQPLILDLAPTLARPIAGATFPMLERQINGGRGGVCGVDKLRGEVKSSIIGCDANCETPGPCRSGDWRLVLVWGGCGGCGGWGGGGGQERRTYARDCFALTYILAEINADIRRISLLANVASHWRSRISELSPGASWRTGFAGRIEIRFVKVEKQ